MNAGESASGSIDSDTVFKIQHTSEGFATLKPRTTPLPGTGSGIQARQIDPNWQIVAVNGQALDAPQALRVDGRKDYTQRVPNDPQTGQWLSWKSSSAPDTERPTYLFQTRVTLPDSVATEAGSIKCRIAVDNRLKAVVVNGHRIPASLR